MQVLRSQLETLTTDNSLLEKRLDDLVQAKARVEQQVIEQQQQQSELQAQLSDQEGLLAHQQAANRHLQSQLEEAHAGQTSLRDEAARLQQVGCCMSAGGGDW